MTGIIFGALFFVIFKKIVPPGTTSRYFKDLTENFFGLLRAEDRFWASYKAIILGSFRYAGLQIAGVFLALLPIGLFFWVAGIPLLSLWNEPAQIQVIPKEAGRITPSPTDRSAFVLILKDGHRVTLNKQPHKYVLCPSKNFSCQSLILLGFHRITVDPDDLNADGKIILRHYRGDWNIFWPYLNDLEFIFYLGILVISLVLPVWGRGKKGRGENGEQQIGAVDYMFMCLAKYHSGAWSRLGNWESRCFGSRLKKVDIQAPVYITGLARAGSTILLELLAGAEGVATHRYRDFPFLMTPILWNGFVSVFSAKQELRERAHQDRILINRESPEAFEEPIWQHYFPQLHAPDTLHLLREDHANPAFERFYGDHVRKILYIRKGRRYLSKGNYNIARVAYILKLYPDARFIISVRHPLTQVYSLLRQHEKFMKYAEENPRVCEYLEAAGHYEFGPQRKPVCITKAGAQRTLEAWRSGDQSLGYAIQWAEIYGHVHGSYLREPELAKHILILRYEDLCANPTETAKKMLTFLGLEDQGVVDKASQTISAPSYSQKLSPNQAQTCWQEVEEAARLYDYSL